MYYLLLNLVKFDNKNEEEDESSSDESEDSSASLVNDTVAEKFLSTMVTLRDEKKAKELLKSTEPIWKGN